MVIDQYARRRYILRQNVAQGFETGQGIEIETKDEIRSTDCRQGLFGIETEDRYPIDIRHPVKEIGIFVGNDHRHVVAHRHQHFPPCQRGPDRVAVRVGMRDQYDLSGAIREQTAEGCDFIVFELHRSNI